MALSLRPQRSGSEPRTRVGALGVLGGARRGYTGHHRSTMPSSQPEPEPDPERAQSLHPTLPFSLGRFTLCRELGAGGMATVYLARMRLAAGLERVVALKTIHAHLAKEQTFVDMFPEYAARCVGEGGMHDTAMLLGALGWDRYPGKVDIVSPYFPSSGTGQVNAEFPVT